MGHRECSFSEGDGNHFTEFTEIYFGRAHANCRFAKIELARERRRNVNRRNRFSKNALRCLLHVYFKPSASALMAFGGRRPSKNATTLLAAITAIFVRVSIEALAMCGVRITSLRGSRAGCALGSFSKTSRAAPAIFLFSSASTSAASSTTGPREVLTRYAVGFIFQRFSFEIRWRVSGINGTWTVTKSAWRNNASRSTYSACSSFSTSAGARTASE